MRRTQKPLNLACRLGFFATFAFLFKVMVSQDPSCGNIGNINVGSNLETTAETNHRFYIDANHPAPCSGNVSTWQYCFYSPTNTDSDGYSATFAIYRRTNSNTQGTFQRVSPALTISLTRMQALPTSGSVRDQQVCQMIEFDQIMIEEGSFIGACITDPQGVSRLDLVGEVTDGSSLTESTITGLLAMSDGECRDTMPERVDLEQLNNRTSLVLHLTAAIAPFDGQLVTTENMTFQSDTTSPPPITDSSSPPSQTTPPSPSPQPAGGGLGAGAIAGIAVLLVLLLLAVLISGVIVVLFLWRRKYYKSVNPKSSHATKGTKNGNTSLTTTQQNADTNTYNYEASAYEIPAESFMKTTSTVFDAPTTKPVPPVYSTLEESSPYEDIYQGTPPDATPVEGTSAHIYAKLIEKNKVEDIYTDLSPYQKPSNKQAELYAQMRSCGTINIPRKDIELTSHLGSGQFGNVERGVWRKENQSQVDVALKTLNKGSSKEDEVKFLQEAAIMAQFRHPNVATLYGVVTQGEPIMFVVELVHKGDLRNHLVSMKPDPGQIPTDDLPRRLLEFSQQVALGMQYLSGKGFIHRDLAARNILVSKNNICKVADFGMSRDLADENYYISRGGKIPVKWTAPEAINFKKYSTASDVWSYGCLLYEIWSLGKKPFDGMRNVEVLRLVESGRRLPPPPGCPKMVYELMILCWHPDTTLRPAFRDLVLALVGGENIVLSIPKDSLEKAGVLGAPVETSERLYQDLQAKYIAPGSEYECEYESYAF